MYYTLPIPTSSSPMAGPNPTLQARIDLEAHRRFVALAKARGLTESALLRLAVEREVGHAESRAIPAMPAPERGATSRITVRLMPKVLAAARERAASMGMAPSRWIASLVQSNLGREPVFTGPELTAVDAAVRELAAIGRNINQIARALNEAHFQTDRVRLDRLAELNEVIEKTRDEIRALARASRGVWSAAP